MNTDDALNFLRQHRPFPDGDLELDQPFLDNLRAVIDHFGKYKDDRCIPLLVDCLSYSSLMGLEPQIENLLLYEYPRELVISALAKAVHSTNEGTRYRAILLSGWFKDRAAFIESYKEALRPDSPETVRLTAASVLEFVVTKEDVAWIARILESESNTEIRLLLEGLWGGLTSEP